MTKQERTLKQIEITLHNIENQCQSILDFMGDIVKENPEYETYFKLLDYVTLAIYDIDEKIKILQ